MADSQRLELDDIVNRPGTYFNPQTEVLMVIDDSPELDGEIFNMEEFEGADWVRISDEVPVDEDRRDELIQRFQIHYHAGEVSENGPDDTDDELEEDDQEGRGGAVRSWIADLDGRRPAAGSGADRLADQGRHRRPGEVVAAGDLLAACRSAG
jgi:hypothetical protein